MALNVYFECIVYIRDVHIPANILIKKIPVEQLWPMWNILQR